MRAATSGAGVGGSNVGERILSYVLSVCPRLKFFRRFDPTKIGSQEIIFIKYLFYYLIILFSQNINILFIYCYFLKKNL